MIEIEQLANILRQRFAIPNLIVCIGILYLLIKVLLIWFGLSKEPEIKLSDINPEKESAFLLKRNISLSDYEIIPNKNLFRSSRTEWIPPVIKESTQTASMSPPLKIFPSPSLLSPLKESSPTLQPKSPPLLKSPPLPPPSLVLSLPSPGKPTPSPEIKIIGLLGGGIYSNRSILEGIYFTPVDFEKKEIKKQGYKLYDMIGQYQISKIDSDKIVLMDPNGKSYEFYMDKDKAKRKEEFNKTVEAKKQNLLGTAVRGVERISGVLTKTDTSPHICGEVTTNPPQHISED